MKTKNEKTDKEVVFTAEQLAAINHDCAADGSVIISAAAGSGKTAVLVEHIIRQICDTDEKIPADKIATMTFTKKAAAEIRARLEKSLTEQISAKGKKEAEWLNEQLVRLDEAHISTISAFCLDIIRVYAVEAGLTPGFRSLDETEADEFMARAMENTLEKLYDVSIFPTAERECLNTLTGEIGDNALSVILRDFHKSAAKQVCPDGWIQNIRESFSNSETDIFGGLLNSAKEVLSERALRFMNICEKSLCIAEDTKFRKTAESDLRLASDWYEWVVSLNGEESGFPDGLKALTTRGFDRALYGKEFDERKTELETLKNNRRDCKKLAEELDEWARLLFAAGKTNSKLAPAVNALIRLYKMLEEEFSSLKLLANAVDFNDMERLCLNLLKKENGRYAEEIGSNLHEIIVDEFQDSNGLQYEIFRTLKSGRGLYLVGDIKQSIYRFRNADPRVFSTVLDDPEYKTLYLNRNFRSGKEVTDAVNDIFDGLMTKKLGGIDYDENARLVFGKNAPKNELQGLPDTYVSEICLMEYSGDDSQDADIYGEISDPPGIKQSEADYIASRIKEMVDGGFLVSDKKSGKRPCRYGDFAVITSALKTVETEFLGAFETLGIPAERGGSGDYLNLGEIILVMDFLKIIDNPYSGDLSVLSVLLSPVYGMSVSDAAVIKAAGISADGKIKPCFYDCLRLFVSDGKNKGTDACKKAVRFMEDIARFRAFAENNPPSRLIRSIFDEGVFLPLIAAAENPYKAEKINSNLKLLLYYADNLSGFTGLDIKHLSGFIRFLGDKADSGKKLNEADAASGGNSVRLLTIHASKGLEFPVCFVARMNASFNKRETDADVIFDDAGIAARYIDPASLRRYDSLSHRLAKNRITGGLLSEEMRKLYVAATRAVDKLIFVGAAAVDEKSGEFKIKHNTYLEWVFGSKAVEKGTLKLVFPEKTAIAAEARHISKDTAVDEAEKKAVIEAISAVYSRRELTAIPKKLTATQIGVMNGAGDIESESDEPSVFPRYPSFLKEKRLTGKKRGDCYHKLMRLISFEARNYAEQIKVLEERFTKEEYKAFDIPQITAFFESNLGRRAVKSDRVCKEIPLYTEINFTELSRFSENPNEGDIKKGTELDEKFTERPFIQGVADMFFYEDGEIVLVDYKTNRRPTADGLKSEYKNQLLIYKKAIEEMTGVRVKECWIYSFEIGEVLVDA